MSREGITGAETGVSSVDVALGDEAMVGDVPLAHSGVEYVHIASRSTATRRDPNMHETAERMQEGSEYCGESDEHGYGSVVDCC